MSAMTQNKPVVEAKMFQILGFDLLIDKDLQVWVLEVNDHPSLNIYHETDPMGSREDAPICPVDYYVKSQLIIDTVALARKTKQDERYGCLSRIFPSTSIPSDISPLVGSLRQLFYKLAPVKDKGTITSSRFEQLATLLVLSGFQKVDLSLSF